jgi:hypothetical protein
MTGLVIGRAWLELITIGIHAGARAVLRVNCGNGYGAQS